MYGTCTYIYTPDSFQWLDNLLRVVDAGGSRSENVWCRSTLRVECVLSSRTSRTVRVSRIGAACVVQARVLRELCPGDSK